MLWIAGAVTSALEWTRIVWPSGAALATALTPMAPPPPGRFSTIMVCPTSAATCSNMVRGSRSVALPAANGTMTWTRLVGQTLAADVCGAGVSAASGPIIVHADAVAAIAASAADLHAFHLCTLSSSRAAPSHATPPTVGSCSPADRFSHHHRQGDGHARTWTSETAR